MKNFLLRARVVVRTSNTKISRRRLADYVKILHQKVCCMCSTIIFPHSTNQIIDLWRCRCRSQILNSLITFFDAARTFTREAKRRYMWRCDFSWHYLNPFSFKSKKTQGRTYKRDNNSCHLTSRDLLQVTFASLVKLYSKDIIKALKWIKNQEKTMPLVYTRLEFGVNWEAATEKIVQEICA